MVELNFSIYHFQIQDDLHDSFEFAEERGASYSKLYASAGLTHHSQLVNFVQECQTYPTLGSRAVALELASNFNPKRGKTFISQARIGKLLGLGVNQIRKYTDEVLATGYWERTINPSSQQREYSLSPTTVVVFAKWRRLDKDVDYKERWGYDTVKIKSKKDMAREVNGFQPLAVERSKLKQIRDNAKGKVPMAKTYEDVLTKIDDVKIATTSEKDSQMLKRVINIASIGISPEHIEVIQNIVAHTIISNQLSGAEGTKLFGKLVDKVTTTPEMTNDSVVKAMELAMLSRAEQAEEQNSSDTKHSTPSDVSGVEFFSLT